MTSFPVLPPTTDNAGLMLAKQITLQGKPAIQLDWSWDVTPGPIPSTYDELIQFVDPLGDPLDPYNQAPGVEGYQVLSDLYLGDQQTGYSGNAAQELRRLVFPLPDGQAGISQTLYFGAYQGDTGSEIFCGIDYVAPPALRTQEDIEAYVINFLRTDPDMIATGVGDRTYGRMPNDKTFPLQLVTRITSNMLEQIPNLEFEQVTLQLDTFGGTKADTQSIHQIARAVLGQRLVDPATVNGIVAVDTGSMSYLPDQDFDPPKARYTSDTLVTVRPST